MPQVRHITPPKAKGVQYAAPLGTRWDKEKAAAPKGSLDFVDDPQNIGPWIIGECVGKGASGRVKIARHSQTGQMAAVKILPLEAVISSRLSMRSKDAKLEKHRNGIDREIIMMKLMNHPNIVRIYDVYEGKKELFLILEYVQGGELFDYLVNHGRMEPMKGLIYFKQIIYGLSYAHAFSIIHRDLKPENILIHSLRPPRIKIADWGMAAFAPPSHQLETSCGSPHYASPEIVNGKRYSGTATDIWSCGVILFALMTGRLPFDDKNIKILLGKVKAGKFDIPTYVHPEAADLIRRMLVVDVNERITMSAILAHPFLKHATPGISYVSAPSIAELDRPLRSTSLINQDLLRSLLVIWGNATHDEMVAELLSPPGQGSLAKAMYFLLNKHRERTLEDYGVRDVALVQDPTIKQYIAPPPKSKPGLSSDSGPLSSDTIEASATPLGEIVVDIRASRVAPAPPVPHSPMVLSPPAPESPRLMSPGRTSSSIRSRPPSPGGPRSPTPYERASNSRARPVSTPGSSVMYDHRFHQEPRTRHRAPTIDGVPSYEHGHHSYSPRTRSVIHSPPLSRTSTTPMQYDPYAQSPQLPPITTVAQPSWGIEAVMGTAAVAGAGAGVNGSSAGIGITAPTVADPELQAAINSIAGRFNVLVAQRNFLNGAGSGGSAATQSVLSADSSIHNKENEALNSSADSSAMDVDGQSEQVKISPKSDKGKKSSPHYNQRRITVHTSSPSKAHKDSNVHQRTSSYVPAPSAVGEFKGWFANLFNWKAQQYVLHSVDNCQTTREEVARLLKSFGCSVILEDTQGWGVLKCKMEEQYDTALTTITLKPVRFRVEFSPVLGYTNHSQPYRHSQLNTQTSSSSSTNQVPATTTSTHAPTATTPFSPRTGTSVSINSTTASSHLGAKNLVPFASTLVLVQEKGALSTFKYIYQRLRSDWRLDALRSPDLTGATPVVPGTTPRLR